MEFLFECSTRYLSAILVKAKEYYKKSLSISAEISYREGEAKANGNIGVVFYCLRDYHEVKNISRKHLRSVKKSPTENGRFILRKPVK